MENLNMASSITNANMTVKPTVLEGKHEELSRKVISLESIEKELSDIGSKLRGLAHKINPEDFENGEKTLSTTGASDLKDGQSPKRYGDGLVGAMDNHIHQLGTRVYDLQLQVKAILKTVNFLHEQI